MIVVKKKFQKGFTLVELLVTITIFVLLTGVVLFNQSKFNSTILLTNLAYDTALTIREAQTYGVNIKEFNGSNDFVPYGVHFETGANNKSFILFADLDKNGSYDGVVGSCSPTPSTGKKDGCVNRYSIKRGNTISNIFVVDSDGGEVSVNKLDLTFKRPSPDAVIIGIDSDDESITASKAIITLAGVDGVSTSSVVVQSNGLIEIENN